MNQNRHEFNTITPAFRRRRLAVSILPFLVVLLLVGCSSQKETIQIQENPSPSSSSINPANEPLLPRPAFDIESITLVPDVNLVDLEPLLDRARLHIVLANKALLNKDTISALDQCILAASRLERLTAFPNRDVTTDFNELLQNLVSISKRCDPLSQWQLPQSLIAEVEPLEQSAQQEEIALPTLSFKEPPPTTIPLPINEDVERNIVYFSTKVRSHFEKWLERSTRYFPIMRPILKEEGMPDEIIFLTMIESGVNPIARSWAKCVGLWQFLKSTGEMYGLRGDWYFDDRRDPEKATRAAARHLRDLFNRYDDWHLALAAYNAGAGRIDRAIKRSPKEKPSYWDIRQYLPSETQEYVPRYIAASIIALNQEAYDFSELRFLGPLEHDVVRIDNSYAIADLAECVGISQEEFTLYNPHILQSNTPPDVKGFEIKVPKGRKETFASNLTSLTPVRRPEMVVHKVRRGETVHRVAKLYAVSDEDILRANEMSRPRKLVVGELLRVPKVDAVNTVSLATAMDNMKGGSSDESDPLKRTKGRELQTYLVESGMTLGGIARRFNVTVSDLITWNSMKSEDRLLAGTELKIWVRPGEEENLTEPPVTVAENSEQQIHPIVKAKAASPEITRLERYRVQQGETLASIAGVFGVTMDNIKRWNRMRTNQVRSGKVLKIYRPVTTIAGKPVYDAQEKPKDKKSSTLSTESEKDSSVLSRNTTPTKVEAQNQQAATQTSKTTSVVTTDADNLLKTSPTAGEIPRGHKVAKGETLWSISERYGFSPSDIKRWNNLSSESLKAGQILRLAAPQASNTIAKDSNTIAQKEVGEQMSDSLKPERHIVGKGESLWGIAKQYGVTVGDLMKWNGLTEDRVQAGQSLVMKSESVEKPLEEMKAEVVKRYVVEKGDNLYSISRKLGVSVKDLNKWNRLEGVLQPGQELTYHGQE